MNRNTKHRATVATYTRGGWEISVTRPTIHIVPARTGIKHRRICIPSLRGTSLWSACVHEVRLESVEGIGNGAGRLLCVYTRRGQESVNRKRRVDCCILHATCFDTGCGLMRVMIVYVARFSNPPIPIQISFIHHGGSPILRCHFWTSCSNETHANWIPVYSRWIFLSYDFFAHLFLCEFLDEVFEKIFKVVY